MEVVNCSIAFRRRSWARQSKRSRQYSTSSRRYLMSVPSAQPSPCSGSGTAGSAAWS